MTAGSSSTPTEGLADRDLNEREDAYEWEPGHQATVAPTVRPSVTLRQLHRADLDRHGPLGSSLLGASADGIDAYFFTRDTLVTRRSKRQPGQDLRRPCGWAASPQSPHRFPARRPTSATAPAARRRRRRTSNDRRHAGGNAHRNARQVQGGLRAASTASA